MRPRARCRADRPVCPCQPPCRIARWGTDREDTTWRTASASPQRLDGQRILLTGATGFVGEALLHLLLTEVPGVHVTLLVRAKGSTIGRGSGSAPCSASRSSADLVEAAGGLDELMDARVRVLEGDLADVPAAAARPRRGRALRR